MTAADARPPVSRTRSLAFRLVTGAALWSATTLAVGGFLLSGLFASAVERAFEARLLVLLDGLVAVTDIGIDGQPRPLQGLAEPRFDQPFSGWYWQVATTDGALVRSRSLWDRRLARHFTAPGGGLHLTPQDGPMGERLQVLERDITLPGSDAVYQFAVAADTAETASEKRDFDHVLFGALGGLGAILVSAILLQVRYGLGPLHRLSAGLHAIRSGRKSRLDGGYPQEIAPLAEELNALLEHNEAVVERARTHVGNLAHGLKTPLTVLTNEIAHGEPAPAEAVRRQVLIMRHLIDHQLARASAAGTSRVLGARTDPKPVIDALLRTLARMYVERALTYESAPEPDAPAFRGERQDLEEMLGNLLDNASKWAKGMVRIGWGRAEDGKLALWVEDDGPGLDAVQRAVVFERGRRLDEAVPGSGLGLSIVRDMALLYGGDVSLDEAALGGLRARLTLPAAEPVMEEAG